MSLTGEGRRGQPSPPGAQGRAERKTSLPLPCFLGGRVPMALGLPQSSRAGPSPGQGDQHAGEGSDRGGWCHWRSRSSR